MKWSMVHLATLLALVVIQGAYAEDIDIDNIDLEDLGDIGDFGEEELESLLREAEDDKVKSDMHRENTLAAKIAADIHAEPKSPLTVDPCSKIHCSAGRVCRAEGKTASCVCIPECPPEHEPRRQVCTNKNETWSSDCEVYRQRCLCENNDTQCKGPEFKHFHIDYYGACHEQPDCTEEEMNDFPRRMRDWLFNVMRDLADRDELPVHYKEMELEAETNMTRRWANAAVWKFCDLDGEPHDRSVSRHELFPIRAPLMSLEHCIAPFLESCDKDGNHRITLKEWGKCLQIDSDDLVERCDDISNNDNKVRG